VGGAGGGVVCGVFVIFVNQRAERGHSIPYTMHTLVPCVDRGDSCAADCLAADSICCRKCALGDLGWCSHRPPDAHFL
jgi:hypothetical protein